MTESSKNTELKGFSYYVFNEQLAAFTKLTVLERMQWVVEARHEALRKSNIE